ncbi:MAG: diguanylate cyclase [Desulfobacterales bacterium]|nr:diguanylate cyclase [Desulfobacterales bacterium]
MPDNTKTEAAREKLLALRQNYARQLPDKLIQIKEIQNQLASGEWNDERGRVLHNLFHKLAGAGETFGFPELSHVARDGEILVKSVLDTRLEPGSYRKTEIDELVSRLMQVCENSLEETDIDVGLYLSIKGMKDQKTRSRMVFLVEDDKELAEYLAVQIGYYGYEPRVFENLEQFRKALDETEPLVVIMDIQLPDGNGAEIMAKIQKGRDTPLNVVFISVLSDLNARLLAVRAGGVAYFHKPVDLSRLIDTLDHLVEGDPEPSRILIVDDSWFMTEKYKLVLQKAGMEARTVNDPLKIMEPLEEFRPDLILMDMYMPECSGLELAKVIRQQEAFVSVPIVYLSGETDIDVQLEAMIPGGDDFLTKPIKSRHLILSVTSRVTRSRILRSFMIRDSLTGLLNHTRIKEHLDIEVERAKRGQGQMAFAMIDIDKFKSVNDTYGHPVGDQVIKSLSRLLKQRLRKTDIVGRYGGEEFAAILPETDGAGAKKVLDELRIAFGQIRHQHEHTDFTVTISCGVAAFPDFPSAASLNEAADQALYQAKNTGRNRVEIA